MSSIPPPINPEDKSKQWIETHRLEKDRKAKDETPPEPSPSKVYVLLHFIIKKVFPFLASEEKKAAPLDVTRLTEDLTSIKKILESLKNEDLSHNPQLAVQLSDRWHRLVEDFNTNKVEYVAKVPRIVQDLESFFKKVNSYPPNEDLNLGYYLKEYVGKEWLPFPFMDILHQLHEEKKTLEEWIQLLDDIISSF